MQSQPHKALLQHSIAYSIHHTTTTPYWLIIIPGRLFAVWQHHPLTTPEMATGVPRIDENEKPPIKLCRRYRLVSMKSFRRIIVYVREVENSYRVNVVKIMVDGASV